jgi:cytidine deaminase
MQTPPTLDRLYQLAREASGRAYCPYSSFRVGAVVATQSGEIFTGCNVENASYGLTICAERNAIFQMAAQAHRDIQTLVIFTPTNIPAAPCGACRQVINEFGPLARIIAICNSDQRLDTTLTQLLPDAFGPKNLS